MSDKEELHNENQNESKDFKIYEGIIKENHENKSSYLYTFGSFIINIIILIITIMFFMYSLSYEPPIQYVIVDKDGRVIEDKSLEEFNKTNNEIKQWLVRALEESFSYDFTNIETHPSKIKKHYTERGYSKFTKQFEESSDIVLTKKEKAVSSVIKINPPKILKEGVANGVAAIRFETEMTQYFQAKDGNRRERYKVVVVITRQDIKEYEEGLAIESLIRSKNEPK